MTPSIRRASRLLLLAGALAGCKSMTGLKEEEIAKEEEKRKAAWETRLDEKVNEYIRLVDEEVRRANFQNELATAADLLDTQDFLGALRAAEAILDPPLRKAKDPATGNDIEEKVEPPGPRDRSRALAIKGRALLQSEKREDGLRALEEALFLDRSNRPARRALGKAHLDAGRYREAIQAWGGELADGYRDSELLLWVATAHRELARSTQNPRHIEAARIAYEDVLLEKPEDVEVRRSLAVLELEAGRYAEAARHLEALRPENPVDPDHLELLGNTYLKVPDRAKAADCLELAAQYKPPSKEGCVALSGLFEGEGLPGRAAEWLSRAHRQNPAEASPEERFQAGSLFARAGRSEEAMLWLSAIAEGEPRHVEAQGLLASLFRAAGREDEAIAAFEKVRRSRPQDGEAHLAAGDIFLARKQLDQALDAYSKASGLPDTKVAGLIGLAEASYGKRNLSAALRHYRRALEEEPGSSRCIRAIQRIEDEIRWSARPSSAGATP